MGLWEESNPLAVQHLPSIRLISLGAADETFSILAIPLCIIFKPLISASYSDSRTFAGEMDNAQRSWLRHANGSCSQLLFSPFHSSRHWLEGMCVSPLCVARVSHCPPAVVAAAGLCWAPSAGTEGGDVLRAPFCCCRLRPRVPALQRSVMVVAGQREPKGATGCRELRCTQQEANLLSSLL